MPVKGPTYATHAAARNTLPTCEIGAIRVTFGREGGEGGGGGGRKGGKEGGREERREGGRGGREGKAPIPGANRSDGSNPK